MMNQEVRRILFVKLLTRHGCEIHHNSIYGYGLLKQWYLEIGTVIYILKIIAFVVITSEYGKGMRECFYEFFFVA